MMDETRSRAPLDRHGERGDGELGAHVVAHGPADHLAGTAGCAKRGRGASSVSRMGISRV
jgi:hypothetical protein